MKLNKLEKQTKDNFITYGVILLVFVLVQLMQSAGMLSNLMQGILVPICIYIIMAVSLNLTVGILGELSLGHAGFMCVGAYAGAVFSKCMVDAIPGNGLRFFLAILVGAAFAAVFGVLIGIPVLRLKGDYLAIVTLAFGEIIKNFMNVIYFGIDQKGIHFSMKDTAALGLEADGNVIIKGAQGITGTPKSSNFFIGILLILLTLLIVNHLIQSRAGRAIMAIRDNRIAAESIGIQVTKYKLLAFSISASLAGIAGVLYAHNLSTLTTKNFSYNTSILVLVFVVLGGIGNIRGSVIAAAVLTLLPELLRGLSEYRMLIYAIVLIVAMLVSNNPQIANYREQLLAKMKDRKKATKEAK